MRVMTAADMFAHKLCALFDRNVFTNRDMFDSWFLMQKHLPVNKDIIEFRMKMPYKEYLHSCIQRIESMSDRGLLQGLGELMDDRMKTFVRTKLRNETIGLLKFYKDLPIFS